MGFCCLCDGDGMVSVLPGDDFPGPKRILIEASPNSRVNPKKHSVLTKPQQHIVMEVACLETFVGLIVAI